MHNSPKPTNVRWTVFALACGSSWLLYLHRYAFALIKPKIAEEWHLDKTELGLLDSVFFTFYTVFQVPLGIAVDAGGVRLVLTGMLVVGSIGLAMHAWAANSGTMWYARATLGAGQSAVYAALTRVSSHWFPAAIRSTLQGLVGVTSGRFGGLSANVLFGSLLLGVLACDWRTATYVFVAIGIVHTLLFVTLFRNTPRQHPWVNEAEASLIEGEATAAKPARKMTVREMLRHVTPLGLLNLLALNVQTILSTFADNIYSNWIPLFLDEVHRLKWQELGVYSALPLLGGAIAGVVGGWLNDRLIAWTGNRRWARSGVAACGKGLAAVWLLIALLYYDQPYVFCGLLFLVKLFGDWSMTTVVGVVTDIGGRATASVYAFNNTVAGIGSIVAPAVFGYVAQHYGWRVVFLSVAGMYVLCALSWLLVNCTIPIIKASDQR